LIEADPADEAADEAVAFARLAQCVDDAPAHETEIAGVDGDRDVGEPANDAVERRRGQNFEAAFAAAPTAGGVHDIVAGPIALEKVTDEFGRVLQVAVHEHDGVAAGRVQAGRGRDLMAEISRQREHAQVRVDPRGGDELLTGGVAAPVVDADDFIIERRFGQAAHDCRDAAQQFVDVAGLIVKRDHDA